MPINARPLLWIILIGGLIFTLYQLYPHILFQVAEWQRHFNLELSASLKSIKAQPQQAGMTLMAVSFLYGVFHAIGPGHGKFILTGYLSLEETKLPKAIRITLLSALVQGLVAIGLVTLIVVVFTLSRSYFNLTLKWVERGSFIMMILFGCYWCYQAVKERKPVPKKNQGFQIHHLQKIERNAPLVQAVSHQHTENCPCGHRHLPSANELANATDWKTVWMLILSIGLRPCTGAVLVLFLAYTLDLYLWGVASALLMAAGTGLTLTLFACVVLFARGQAIRAGRWYLSVQTGKRFVSGLKLLLGIALIGLGVTLFHSSLLESSGSLLFKR